jgi:SAM-dependent methyltransferase
MSARRVPGAPPRPLFAIIVALRNLLVRLWRKLVPPEIAMFESILYGLLTVHIARTACQLGLPEQLIDGPRSVEELARATGTQQALLERFLRALASHEILIEHRDSRYALAPLGRTLLPGTRGSMRGAALLLGSRWVQGSWHELADTLRTGKTGIQIAYETTAWEYLAAHPEERRDFNDAMVNITTTDAPAFARGVDFSQAKRVCDVGGGYGTVLAHVLAQNQHLEGVLFDAQAVLDGARPVLDAWGVADRVQLVGGDFFSSVPAGCDVYFLRQVIHDWDDARAEKILRTVRAAMQPGQRVLVYDMLRSERVSQHPAFSLDLMMMVVTDHGRERSVLETKALLARCGFQPGRVMALAAPLGVVEGVAV